MISGLRIGFLCGENFSFFCCLLYSTSKLLRNERIYGFFEFDWGLLGKRPFCSPYFSLSLHLLSLLPPFNFLSTKLIFSISQRLRKYKEVKVPWEREMMQCARDNDFLKFFFVVVVCEKNVNDQSLMPIPIDFSHFPSLDCIQLSNQRIWRKKNQAKTNHQIFFSNIRYSWLNIEKSYNFMLINHETLNNQIRFRKLLSVQPFLKLDWFNFSSFVWVFFRSATLLLANVSDWSHFAVSHLMRTIFWIMLLLFLLLFLLLVRKIVSKTFFSLRKKFFLFNECESWITFPV